ncbi:bile acid:sodium symporter family protein [Algoriphagus sp. C2-6-M1]|uniref:bile acid:sodium symporter family protein n=1 Tax=Algoriphagus persicinus TaxID=3108754 RepID=UPI002B389F79|nr:bile acid:sodium symporter family protein [Algoriphagus sp. C2-6-M1]MEB2782087.1 bile acid:sodium symporter family protein [Algoriphagus sp. C2-6-M1]
MNLKITKILSIVTGVLFLAALATSLFAGIANAGLLWIGFFFICAIAFLGSTTLKGYAYSMMIFGSVAIALYFPQYFIEYDGFKFSALIVPLIQVIMFGMGTSMSIKDFLGVVKMPKGVVIGVLCQFSIMPFIGFGLANMSGFPPEIAAGIILIGCSPSGMASNVMSYLARANLALSITVTSVTTLLAPFATPFLMGWLAGEFVEINVLDMMVSIVKMVILPIGAGLIFNYFLRGKAKWLDDLMPILSMAAIAVILVVIVSAGRDSLLDIGPLLIMLVLFHNLAGYTLGYWVSRLLRLNEKDCRTIAIEVGMQNGGLASGIAKEMGKIATVGLAPAVFGPLMNVTGSILASYWHKKPTEPEEVSQ